MAADQGAATMLPPLFDETADQRRAICACGRFVSDVVATVGVESIREVHGTCKTHGRVEAFINGGWYWEDFYGWD